MKQEVDNIALGMQSVNVSKADVRDVLWVKLCCAIAAVISIDELADNY